MGGIDLHTHTVASDGTYTPAELVREAVRRGVRVLAVTDHDSVEAVAPAIAVARDHPPLEIVPGIEINTDGPGGEIHVLGYFLDHEAEWLRDLLREFRAERVARVHRIADRLAELGHPIDAEEVFALVQEGSAGRPHVAQIMVRRGYVGTVREAFDRFLGAGKPAHVGHRKVLPREACEIIRRAGGLAVVAHPGFHDDPDRMIRELAATGLLGRRRVLLRRALGGADDAAPRPLPGARARGDRRLRLPRSPGAGGHAGAALRPVGGLGSSQASGRPLTGPPGPPRLRARRALMRPRFSILALRAILCAVPWFSDVRRRAGPIRRRGPIRVGVSLAVTGPAHGGASRCCRECSWRSRT